MSSFFSNVFHTVTAFFISILMVAHVVPAPTNPELIVVKEESATSTQIIASSSSVSKVTSFIADHIPKIKNIVAEVTKQKPDTTKTEDPAIHIQQNTPTNPSFDISGIPFFIGKSTWKFSTTDASQYPTSKRPPAEDFVNLSELKERPVDPKTVVLVRCKYTGTYIGSTSGIVAPIFTTGSGVVVSSSGYILTAGHVLRFDQEINRDDKQRVWKRDSCDVAPTDSKLTPINAEDYENKTDSTFIPATIVFEPSEVEYHTAKTQDPDDPNYTIYLGGGANLDFALLQVQGANLPYVPIIDRLSYLKAGEKMLGLGYPGLVTSEAQHLERIDVQFNGFVWMENSTCDSETVLRGCGIRYQAKRYKDDYKKLYEKNTELGRYTSFFRGGFSGGPLFYKGYVAGIMISGKEGGWSNLYDLSIVGQWNWVEALATHEILITLKKHDISLPTAP